MMKFHNIWTLVCIALVIYVTFGEPSAFQKVGVFMFQLACVLFWYLGEIRAYLKSISDKQQG